jgi:heme exporter protein B
VNAFSAVLMRDIKLAVRAGGGASLACAFFALVAALVPFGVGADLVLLGRIAGGVLWVAAALAALLSLDRLFQADFEDGSLDVLALSPLSLESVATAKILAHWLTTGLPLVVLSPLLGLLLNLPAPGYAPLMATLAIGTPALSGVGAIGAALTLSVRRGGLILALIVLPLITPALIFGSGAVTDALDGTGRGAFIFLAAFSFAASALSPFAAAAAVRLNIGS